jgi:hypothetical protein
MPKPDKKKGEEKTQAKSGPKPLFGKKGKLIQKTVTLGLLAKDWNFLNSHGQANAAWIRDVIMQRRKEAEDDGASFPDELIDWSN